MVLEDTDPILRVWGGSSCIDLVHLKVWDGLRVQLEMRTVGHIKFLSAI